MTVEITTLKQPIDAMYLIHKALRGEADRTVELARSLENRCSLQAFKLAFTPGPPPSCTAPMKKSTPRCPNLWTNPARLPLTAQLSGSNGPCWSKKTANTPGFLRASLTS